MSCGNKTFSKPKPTAEERKIDRKIRKKTKYATRDDWAANRTPHRYLMGKPNVVLAMSGIKEVDGEETGEPCVRVGVIKKIPKYQLKEEDLVPKVLPNGSITDVFECGKISACADHRAKYRPLRGGISAIARGATACTLGAVVKDNTDGLPVALTNYHCTGMSGPVGHPMLQPSPYDGGSHPGDTYGYIKRFSLTSYIDGGISSITDPGSNASMEILATGGGPFLFAEEEELQVGDYIQKSSRTTGKIPPPSTKISSVSASLTVSYGSFNHSFSEQIITTSSYAHGLGGDSGSVITFNHGGVEKIAGLFFAGNAAGTLGVSNHIYNVASTLNVSSFAETIELDNIGILISGVWRDMHSMQINVNDIWRNVEKIEINIGDSWKLVTEA